MTRHYKELLRDDADNAGMDKPGTHQPSEKYRSQPAEFVFPKQAAEARERGLELWEWLLELQKRMEG